MRKRVIALALAALLVCSVIPFIGATEDDYYTGEAPVVGEKAADVAALLDGCTNHTLEARTEVMNAVHDLLIKRMEMGIKSDNLAQAQEALAEMESQYLMGLVLQEDMDAAQDAVKTAQGESDKAALEALKLVTKLRSLTTMDSMETPLDANDFFLTLTPEQLVLDELKAALDSRSLMFDDAEMAKMELEQDYIDVSLSYAELAGAAETYIAAQEARDAMAKDLIMGKATDADFRAATATMKQERLNLMSAMSEYSKLLYKINKTCGGILSDKCGKLTEFLGSAA